MVRLSGAAVLLLLVVPLCMYTYALFVGIQLGRALERRPDSANIISIRGAVHYFAKELWDIQRRGRDFAGAGHGKVFHLEHHVPARARERARAPIQPKQDVYSRPKSDLETSVARSYGNRNNHTWQKELQPGGGVISVGPWGGSGGHPFSIRGSSSVPHLRSITVYHSSSMIHYSLACEYTLHGSGRRVGPWGLPNNTDLSYIGVRANQIELSAGEHVTAVEGKIRRYWNLPDVVIGSLTFRTSTGRTYGPYGGGVLNEKYTRFSIPAVNGCIVGFWGRSGGFLDAIGVYIKPCP